MAIWILSLSGGLLVFGTGNWLIWRERKRSKYSPFTEPSLRSPGYTLGKEIDTQSDKLLIPVLVVSFLPLIYFLVTKGPETSLKIVAAIPFLALIVWQLRRISVFFVEAGKKRLGLDGEVYTGQELNFLMRSGAWVYHDIPYQYGNIDHIVVSNGGVFTVETKAIRKPSDEDGKRQSSVILMGGVLHFPHGRTRNPIKQAKRHANHVEEFLFKKTGEHYPVKPVVAIPGWFVDTSSASDEILVINPKRGNALKSRVQKSLISDKDTQIIANLIDKYARTVHSSIEMTDPDGGKKYSILLDRKLETPKL